LKGSTAEGVSWELPENGISIIGEIVLTGSPSDSETQQAIALLSYLQVPFDFVPPPLTEDGGKPTPLLVVNKEPLSENREYDGIAGIRRFVRRIRFDGPVDLDQVLDSVLVPAPQ
jgi:hypothetical protein